MRNWIQHKLCPLHLYCRLMDMGFGQARAWRIASRWERVYEMIWGIDG